MAQTSIIIIGAGAAGLAAARILSAAGSRVIVLEGRNRIGGRIFTVHNRSMDMPIELGAEFIHGTPKSTMELVRAGELPHYDAPFEHLQKSANGWTDPSQYASDLKKGMSGLNQLGKRDMSFSDYLTTYRSGKSLARARQTALAFVEGFDAADPERISAQSLAEEQEGLGDLEHESQFRLLKGYASLMDWLRRGLDHQRVRILLKKIVKEIHWKQKQVDVACERRSQSFRADRLLVTLPIGILQLPPEAQDAVRFFPDIPEKRRHANRLGSGAIVKIIMRFQNAFWEQPSLGTTKSSTPNLADAVFLHDPQAAFPTWWTARPLRLPLLTGWVGGPKALQISGQPPAAIRTIALKSLSSLFGIRPARLGGMLAEFYCHDWSADPLARGAYSYTTVNGKTAHQKLAQSLDETLFFAGEATDTSGEASTVAGAIASGQRTANEILASL